MDKVKIIIVGENHYNTLGLIRSLGIKGLHIDIIVLSEKRKVYIQQSKYVSKCLIINHIKDLFSSICSLCVDNTCNYYLYSGSDQLTIKVDEIRNDLPSNIFVPYATNYGGITKLMNKSYTSSIAFESGLLIPKSWTVSKENLEVFLNDTIFLIDFECIIKPLSSILGSKHDVYICSTQNDISKYLVLVLKKVEAVVIQQYIRKDYETSILGVSLPSREVIVPGIIKKIREFPFNMGSSSFCQMLPNVDDYVNMDIIRNFLLTIGYVGLFSIEFVVKDNNFYFLEINLRNDGNVPMGDGVNLPYLLLLDIMKYNHMLEKKKLTKSLYFMIEIKDFKYMLNKPLNPFVWLQSLYKTDCFLLWNKKDIKPFLYKFIYA